MSALIISDFTMRMVPLTAGITSTADRIYYVNDSGQFDIFYYQQAPYLPEEMGGASSGQVLPPIKKTALYLPDVQ